MNLGSEVNCFLFPWETKNKGVFLKGDVVNIRLVMKNNYYSLLRCWLQNFQSSCGLHKAVLLLSFVVFNWLLLIIIYILKNGGIEMQAGKEEWQCFVVDFSVVPKGSLLVPVLPLKGHGDLKQWRKARGEGHGCQQPLLAALCRARQTPLLRSQHGNSWLDWKAIFSIEVTSGNNNRRVWSYTPTKLLDL